MKLAHFFIDHPRFAAVLSIFIALAGLAAWGVGALVPRVDAPAPPAERFVDTTNWSRGRPCRSDSGMIATWCCSTSPPRTASSSITFPAPSCSPALMAPAFPYG